MQINVKQPHIDRGSPGSTSECALALAANEAFMAALAGAAWVSTTVAGKGPHMRVETDSRVLYFGLPTVAVHFVANYDGVNGKAGRAKAQPFAFEAIPSANTTWKAKTDAVRFERLLFEEEKAEYILCKRNDQGDLDPNVMDDAEAARWMAAHGHALHERLADRGITPQ